MHTAFSENDKLGEFDGWGAQSYLTLVVRTLVEFLLKNKSQDYHMIYEEILLTLETLYIKNLALIRLADHGKKDYYFKLAKTVANRLLVLKEDQTLPIETGWDNHSMYV